MLKKIQLEKEQRHFTKEDMQMANKNTEDVQHHYPLEKCKLKAQRISLYTYQND